MRIDNSTPFEVDGLIFPHGPGGGPVLTVIVKGTFEIIPGGPARVAESQVPIAYGDDPWDDSRPSSLKYESDIVPFKPTADVTLVGYARAPGSASVQALDVELRVGSLRRTLRVIGDRQWTVSNIYGTLPSEPVPFTEMPLVYERAFGGMDATTGELCAANPLGKGFFSQSSKGSVAGLSLPNIEDPNALLTTPVDQPQPVGFGCVGKGWAPRVSLLGTYDEAWETTRRPAPPGDFDFRYYNCAHPDWQVSGYLQGGEVIYARNLGSNPDLTFELPRWEISVHVYHGDPLAGVVEENLGAHLDSCCLFLDDGQLHLVWRATMPLPETLPRHPIEIFVDADVAEPGQES